MKRSAEQRCKVCRHLKRWHHGQYVPVMAGKIGRSAECRRCHGVDRRHEFEISR